MLSKIKTKEEIDKKKRRNQIIIGIILVGLMIVSTASYAFLDNGEDEVNFHKSGELKFYKSGNLWQVEIQGYNFHFNYLPEELSNVTFSGTFSIQDLANKPLYFVNSNYASQQILSNVGSFVLRSQEACLDETCTDFPIKNCSSDNVIIFKESNETSVYSQNKCIFISGEYSKGADAFIYKILGIM